MTTTTTATTMEYDNEDEWLIHCGSLLGVLSSSSVTSGMEFTGVDDDDDDAGDDDHNNCSVHHPHPKSDEEEFIKEVDDNVGFFDEGDFIGCYVSYDKHEDDVAWNDHDDNNNEDTLLPCPPLSDPATAALHFHTPTTTTTSGRHDQTTTTTTNTVTTKPKRKRTRRDPQKPKGWLTPVLLYSNANRARVKLENPNKSFGDVARILSAEFKNLSSKDAATWRNVSEEDKARHDREMKVFVESISSCQKYTASEGIDCAASNHYESDDTLLSTGVVNGEEEAAVVVMASKAKRAKKTKGVASHIPIAHNFFRNVLSPHFIFVVTLMLLLLPLLYKTRVFPAAWNFFTQGQVRKQAHDANLGAPLKVIMRTLGRQFKELSPEERAIYDDMADADRVRNATEKARYKTITCIGD